MKARLTMQKVYASVLATAITIGVVPNLIGNSDVLADTAKDQNNTCLGTSSIKNPTAPENKDSTWEGSYVYYGAYDAGSGKEPIKFRVLDNILDPMDATFGFYMGTDLFMTPTLFLDSDKILFYDIFNNDSNEWNGSTLMGYLCNGFQKDFTAQEQSAMLENVVPGRDNYIENSNYYKHYFKKYVGLDEEKVFLLDAEDVCNPAYGYYKGSGDSLKKCDMKGNVADWWLRTAPANDSSQAGDVSINGQLEFCSVDQNKFGVAPALNVKISDILFSTAVKGYMGETGTEYKLTLIDDSLTVNLGSVSVNGMKFSCPATSSSDRVSILITDGEWDAAGSKIKYYSAFDGTFDISSAGLKASDWGTNYHVYLFAEDINGTYETDYASIPVELAKPSCTFTVTFNANGKGTAPSAQTVTYGSKATKPTDLEVTGFTFGGWYTDSACTKAYDFNSEVTSNITLYAKWTATSTPAPSTPAPTTPAPSTTGGGFEDFVERLYTVALGRASEPEGKAFWCEHVGNGDLNGAQCANEFLLSKEFNDRKLTDEQFLEVLYKTFFNREAKDDKDGFNFWMNCLKTQGRDSVVDCFINSEEWCNVCASYGVRSGATRAKATIASANATAFATRLQTECLGRDPEEGGLKFLSLGLTNLELTGKQAAHEFFFSKEFNDFNLDNKGLLTRMYKTFMGREPDDDGMNYWLKEMSNGMTKEQVFECFVNSAEFTQICKDYAIDRG